MAWNNGYPTRGPRHSPRAVAVPRPPSGVGAGATAAAAKAAGKYGPKILLHGSGIGAFYSLVTAGIEAYNLYQEYIHPPTAFSTFGWTLVCDNGGARTDWASRPDLCSAGGIQTNGNFFAAPYYHKITYAQNIGWRRYRMNWWRNVGGLTPWAESAHYYKRVDTPYPADQIPTEFPATHPSWVTYGPGNYNLLASREIRLPTAVALPIGSSVVSYPIPETHRNRWGANLGIGYVNVPGNPPARPVAAPRPIIIPVPIPGFPGVPLPVVPGTGSPGVPVVTNPPNVGVPLPGVGVGVPPIVTPIPVDPVVVVPRAPTYVAANVHGIALAHTRHVYAPPGPRMKEGKVKGVPRAAMAVLGTVTETLDVLDCLHRGLSKARQAKRTKKPKMGKAVYNGTKLVRGFSWQKPRPVDKWDAVYDQWKHVDLPGAITCMYEEQILDIAYAQVGKIGGKAAAAARLHGNLPIGFQTGYAH